jgi:RNA polymerase sigma-70 factor (ECF subfamily)
VVELFAGHGRALQAYFRRRVRSKSDAADLAQEVFARLLRVGDAQEIRNPQAYLYMVARNLVNEHLRAQQSRGRQHDPDDQAIQQLLGELPSAESEVEASQMADCLRMTLARIPERWRLALILQYSYGLTYRQIGERLGVSTNMVKKYLGQGLAHCRRYMAQLE